MKKYSVFELSVIKQNRGNDTYQYFICRQDIFSDSYIEIFTKDKIKVANKSLVKPLANYYSILSVCDYSTGKPLMLTLKDLLDKYNEINYINYNLETDERIIETELQQLGIYEKSRIYKTKI